MEDVLVPAVVMVTLFIGLPWLILHYITKWKTAPTLTSNDEELLDELYQLSRRLDDRMETVERLVAADHPARAALGVRDDGMAMASRSDLLARLVTALERPGVDGVLVVYSPKPGTDSDAVAAAVAGDGLTRS